MTGGIVSEYNPLHNGHLYHIGKTKEYGADFIVCVMSGNFVQRGECACVDKWKRAEAAVKGGADVVVDLPVPWAMGSAESFARGSISLLSHFGIDILSFGSESENKELLNSCALFGENEEVVFTLKKCMSKGMNYPSALFEAVKDKFGVEVAKIISSPNSTLAVEYIKQLNKYLPGCDILPVKRVGAEHDSDMLCDGIASASKIRSLISDNSFEGLLPGFVGDIITSGMADGTVPCKTVYAERAVLSSLRQMKKEDYTLYVTDTTGLADRIYNSVKSAQSLEELYGKVKSKNYTHSRVRREVMNVYLNIPNDIHKQLPPYVKILAVNEKGLTLLKNIKDIPVITKHSDIQKLDDFGKRVYELQCSTTDKFALMSQQIRPCGLEQKNSMIVVR